MPCFYCQKQMISTADVGDCVECLLAVCTSPPTRPDKVFHASLCECGCRRLVCVYDGPRHAQKEKSTVPKCFPATTVRLGAAAVAAGVEATHEQRTAEQLRPGEVEAFNEFLNFATPGHQELNAAMQRGERPRRPAPAPAESRKTESGVSWVALAPEFFGEEAIQRITALAAITAIQTWEMGFSRAGKRSDASEWLGPHVVRQLELAVNPLGVLGDRWEGFVRAFTPSRKAPPTTLRRALAELRIPARDDALADWVLAAAAPPRPA